MMFKRDQIKPINRVAMKNLDYAFVKALKDNGWKETKDKDGNKVLEK